MAALSSSTRWLSLVIVVAVLALLFGLWTRHNLGPTNNQPTLSLSNGTVLLQPRLINEFTLTDMNGQPFTRDRLHGHWSLIFFGFTRCPELCPTTLSTLNQMYQQLQTDHQDPLPHIIFISVDTQRDTPQQIKQYITGFNPEFFGATGTTEQLEQLTQQFSVMYAKVMQQNVSNQNATQEDYTIDHSGTLLLVDPNGQLLAIFSTPHEAKALAQSFEKIVSTYQPRYVEHAHQPTAQDIKGNPINLADYRGKWVLINYWATWCHPCLQELPELNQFYHHYSDKVAVLGVSFDQLPASKIQQLAQRFALNFPLLSSFPISALGVENISALPITFLIAPDGHLQETLHGPQTQASLAKAIGML
ncbi:MAG: SCO family protein [Gammaproteobacteria bacterium]